MHKKLLAKQREIISSKFHITTPKEPLFDPYETSFQTTELPASEFSICNEQKQKTETIFSFKKGEEFVRLKQKRPMTFRLNLDSVFRQSNSPSHAPLFSARTINKSQAFGFFTERLRNEKNFNGNSPSSQLMKSGDYFSMRRQYKEKRPRNHTLNELQFKEKFLKNRRRASKDMELQNFLSNTSKRPNSLSLGAKLHRDPETEVTKRDPTEEDSIKNIPRTNKISAKTINASREERKVPKMLNKDKVVIFNNILEQNQLSEIVKEDSKNNLKLNKNLFHPFRQSINLSKDPDSNEYSFKIIQGGQERTLLRYTPITKKHPNAIRRTRSQENDLNIFATDKELEIFNKGFAEMDLCGDSKRPPLTKKKEKHFKETYQESENISSRLFKCLLEKPNRVALIDNMNFTSGFRLSLGQIEYLKEEFEKPERNKMNLDKVDYFLKNLKFFSKFSESIRIHFLKLAKFVEFPASHTIFREGDFGDLMYVILRGSVNIRITKQLDVYEGIASSYVVNSFYDGDHFGDLALMKTNKTSGFMKTKALANHIYRIKDVRQYLNKCDEMIRGYATQNISREAEKSYLGIQENEKTIERTRRAATIETVEQCFCLTLSRDQYQYIYTNILQKSLEEKLNALMNCTLFKDIEGYNLLPLANVLEERTYKLGEPIINKGDPVNSFFIVAKGKCDLVLEYDEIRKMNPFKSLKNRGFKIKDVGDSELFVKSKAKQIKKLDDCPIVKEACLSPRNFPNQKITIKKNKKITNNHMVIKSFLKGDSFGERSLLTDIEVDTKARNFHQYSIPMESQLTVIADMNQTKVFMIKGGGFQAVPIELKTEIRNILMNIPEFDFYNVDELKDEQKVWSILAKKIVKEKVLSDLKKENNLFKLSHLE